MIGSDLLKALPYVQQAPEFESRHLHYRQFFAAYAALYVSDRIA